MRRLVSAFLLLSTVAQASDLNPADLLPPAPAWSGASEHLLRSRDDAWVTPAELTGLEDSPTYDETIAWLRRLEAASPRVRVVPFGRTAQGRTLYLAVASREGARSATELVANGRPTLLAQAGIHAGEIDGKDAGLMLLRDLAFGESGALLDRTNFILIPALNADGHERRSAFSRPNQRGPRVQGWRTTAQNLNLNRDYMKADAPEMRALLGLLLAWQPSLYLDIHVTDGVDYQYDITYGYNGYAGTTAWSPHIAAWLNERLDPALHTALRHAGHIPGPLVFAKNDRDLTAGIGLGTTAPRLSNGYGDLAGIPTVLVENHSLKSYRQRVLGTRVLLEASLRAIADHADPLRRAIETDRAARPTAVPANFGAPGGTIFKDFAGIASEEYVSPISGVKEVRWLGTPRTYEKLPIALNTHRLTLARPRAYYVPVTKPDVIERLRLHGIVFETLEEETSIEAEFARLVNPQPAARPFEGRHALQVAELKWQTRRETFPAGSVRVPTDQPRGTLAMLLLEPASSESLLAWGFFPEILQRTEYIEGYVIAPLAERMLAENAALRAEFEAKLAADEVFRGDAEARLRWFYERSPFYDERYLLYPVGIERTAQR